MFAKIPTHNISLEDCFFYHAQDIPGLNKATTGFFDLRKGVNEYLGNVNFKDKTVLELGPASGYLTFHMEKIGAEVTCIDLSPENDKWDIVPECNYNWKIRERDLMNNGLKKVQNAFWYAHKVLKSNAKVVHSHINNLPENIGMYDVSLIGLVLLHLQNPFKAMQNMLCHTKEKAIVTDLVDRTGVLSMKTKKNFKNLIRNLKRIILPRSPIMEFYPRSNSGPNEIDTWWKLTPEIIVNMASILGFKKNSISYHTQSHKGQSIDMFTVVCERTTPIDECYYE